MSTQRLKNESAVLAVRKDDDSDYAPLKAESLYLTGGTPDVGDVAAALATAQTTANTAVADAAAAAYNAGVAAAAAGVAGSNATTAITEARAAYPSRVAVMGDELVWTVGTPTYSLNQPTFPYDYLIWTSTDLASCYADIQLRSGTWTFVLTAMARNDAPKVVVRLGVPYLSNPLELYAAAAALGKRTTWTGIVISASDVLRLSFTVAGHTAPSTGYVFAPLKFHGYRTGP